MKRRQFVGALTAGTALGILSPGSLLARAVRGDELYIGHVSPAGGETGRAGAAAARGAQLGVAELAQSRSAGRGGVRLLEGTATGAAESIAAAARLVERGATVILGGFERETVAALDELAAEQEVLFLNVGSAADELGQRCRPTTFHVQASASMHRDALTAWLADGGDPDSGATVVGWSPELERHGAGRLNDRYRMRFNESMSAASWASWMAVKIAWYSHTTPREGEPGETAAHLVSERARFDGHKGVALSFRPWDHQLRQPLYIARHGVDGTLRIEAEVPTLAPAEVSADPEALLDTLGGPPRDTGCVPGE